MLPPQASCSCKLIIDLLVRQTQTTRIDREYQRRCSVAQRIVSAGADRRGMTLLNKRQKSSELDLPLCPSGLLDGCLLDCLPLGVRLKLCAFSIITALGIAKSRVSYAFSHARKVAGFSTTV